MEGGGGLLTTPSKAGLRCGTTTGHVHLPSVLFIPLITSITNNTYLCTAYHTFSTLQDLEYLLEKVIDTSVADYAVVTGVQVGAGRGQLIGHPPDYLLL